MQCVIISYVRKARLIKYSIAFITINNSRILLSGPLELAKLKLIIGVNIRRSSYSESYGIGTWKRRTRSRETNNIKVVFLYRSTCS